MEAVGELIENAPWWLKIEKMRVDSMEAEYGERKEVAQWRMM
jgi:hypothetical protein